MTTTAFLRKWGQRYGLTLVQVLALRSIMQTRANQATKECNGDYHPSVPFGKRHDKNANAEAWGREVEATDRAILETARRYGFDGVDFGVGLYPALVKGEDNCIMVP